MVENKDDKPDKPEENKPKYNPSSGSGGGKEPDDLFNLKDFDLSDKGATGGGEKGARIMGDRDIREIIDPFSDDLFSNGKEEVVKDEKPGYDANTTQHLQEKGLLPYLTRTFRIRKEVQKQKSPYDIFQSAEDKTSLRKWWKNVVQDGRLLDSLDNLERLVNGRGAFYLGKPGQITGKRLKVVIEKAEGVVEEGYQQQTVIEASISNINDLRGECGSELERNLREYEAASEAKNYAEEQIKLREQELEKKISEAEQGKIGIAEVRGYKAGVEREIEAYRDTIAEAENNLTITKIEGITNKAAKRDLDGTRSYVSQIREKHRVQVAAAKLYLRLIEQTYKLLCGPEGDGKGAITTIPQVTQKINDIKTEFNKHHKAMSKYLNELNNSLQYSLETRAASTK